MIGLPRPETPELEIVKEIRSLAPAKGLVERPGGGGKSWDACLVFVCKSNHRNEVKSSDASLVIRCKSNRQMQVLLLDASLPRH